MKITLKNLHKATAQQVFDQVATHLLIQRARSVDAYGLCKYRGESGLKCAAGCLISDDEYQGDFDCDMNWDGVCKITGARAHMNLIQTLQYIHDMYSPDLWDKTIREFHIEYPEFGVKYEPT